MSNFTQLIEGYRHFRAGEWAHHRERWAELAAEQHPEVLVIACSDSRVDPMIVFDASPGEIFVIRNVSALVPPFEVGGLRHGVSSALEFAVTQLDIPEIVVMGHGSCGGVAASLSQCFADKGPGEGGFIARWMAMLDEARDRVVAELGKGPEAAHKLEGECVKLSLANLRTFPFVASREAEGRLKLHGAHFAISNGILHLLDEKTGEFTPA
jgi:carbonic anhydrase